MSRHVRIQKKINNKAIFIVFFITMFLFGTSYAILNQSLTLTGTVNIYVDEGNELTITSFNENVDTVVTGSINLIFFNIPYEYCRVVGITIQNSLSKTIDNWTIEFASSRTADLTRPTNNALSAYLGDENAYSSISYANNTVTVSGNDTLAPGETKTVYVFYTYNTGNNRFNFNGNRKAYYTPTRRNYSMALKSRGSELSELIIKKHDESSKGPVEIKTAYYTEPLGGNLYSTTMYIFIGNGEGTTISNVKFDVSYNDSNLSSLSSSEVSILKNTDSGAAFLVQDSIDSGNVKYYYVSGIKTYGGFHGMSISNITYSEGNNVTNNEITNNENIEQSVEKNDVVEENIIIENNAVIENVVEENTIIENNVLEDIITNTISSEYENNINIKKTNDEGN